MLSISVVAIAGLARSTCKIYSSFLNSRLAFSLLFTSINDRESCTIRLADSPFFSVFFFTLAFYCYDSASLWHLLVYPLLRYLGVKNTCLREENVNFNNANEMCERHTDRRADVTVMIADPLHYRFAWLLLVFNETHQQQRGKNINTARSRIKTNSGPA